MSNLLVLLLTVAVAVLAMAVWRQRMEIRRLSSVTTRETDRPAVPLHAARARSVALVPRRSVSPMPDELRSADEALAPSFLPTRAAKSHAASADALARLLDNPEFSEALGLHRQAALDARFGALFRRLALGTDELVAFKRLLAEKENVALDVVAVSETQPDGPLAPEQLSVSVDNARTQVEAAIRSSLGNERYAVYREYEQTLPQRTLVSQLEQRLSYSPAPLTPVQSEALVRIFVAHAPSAPAAPAAAVVVAAGASTAVPVLQLDAPVARVSDAAIAESQAVLTPVQLTALRDLQSEQQASIRAMQLLRDSLPAGDDRRGMPSQILLQ